MKQADHRRPLKLTTQDRRTFLRIINGNVALAKGLQTMIVARWRVKATFEAEMLRNEGTGAIPFVKATFESNDLAEIHEVNPLLGQFINRLHAYAEKLVNKSFPESPEPVRKRWAGILVVLAFDGDATIKQDRSRVGRPPGAQPTTQTKYKQLAKNFYKSQLSEAAYLALHLDIDPRTFRRAIALYPKPDTN